MCGCEGFEDVDCLFEFADCVLDMLVEVQFEIKCQTEYFGFIAGE